MENLVDIKEYFKNDEYATKTSQIEILDAKENYAKCAVKITNAHLNAAGFVMGGLIFTLADFTFAVAVNRRNKWVVSLSSTINYTNPTKGPKLFAETRCVKDGSTIIVIEVNITDDKGLLIAQVVTNGFKQGVKKVENAKSE